MDLTNNATRRQALGSRSQEEISSILALLKPAELIAIGRGAVAALGIYEAKLVKQERIKGKLLDPQTLKLTLRESPRAARIEYVEGPSKGRKVLFNEQIKKDELRVKEGGVLGFAGALWIGFDNPLAKGDTNHRITDLGFGALLDFFQKDLEAGEAFGGHSRRDLGFDSRGRWSTEFTAPPGAKGLQADRAKLTLDLMEGLPLEVEAHDAQGLLEKHRYELVRANLDAPAGFFEPKSFGL